MTDVQWDLRKMPFLVGGRHVAQDEHDWIYGNYFGRHEGELAWEWRVCCEKWAYLASGRWSKKPYNFALLASRAGGDKGNTFFATDVLWENSLFRDPMAHAGIGPAYGFPLYLYPAQRKNQPILL